MTRSKLVIGRLQLGKAPFVVMVVDRNTESLSRASARGVHVLEARIDRFASMGPDAAAKEVKALRKHGLPLIGTVRSRPEGGMRTLTPEARKALYLAILPWVDAVDIELSSARALRSVISRVRAGKKMLILSYHNFKRTPPARELSVKVRRARALGAHIVKIAAFAKRATDVTRLFDFTLKHRKKGIITISMGPKGTLSRILFPSAGSLLTYTSPLPFDGQIPLGSLAQSMKLLYPQKRFR